MLRQEATRGACNRLKSHPAASKQAAHDERIVLPRYWANRHASQLLVERRLLDGHAVVNALRKAGYLLSTVRIFLVQYRILQEDHLTRYGGYDTSLVPSGFSGDWARILHTYRAVVSADYECRFSVRRGGYSVACSPARRAHKSHFRLEEDGRIRFGTDKVDSSSHWFKESPEVEREAART